MMYENFNEVFGFTLCDYNSFIDNTTNNSCGPCPDGTYSVDNYPEQCYSCDDVINVNFEGKMQFLCSMKSSSYNEYEIITAVLICSISSVIIVTIVVIKRRKFTLCKKGSQIDIE